MEVKPTMIKDGVYWIGAIDADLRIFDVIMKTEHGTTYNSYLVKGSEKIAIFETVKDRFFESYLENLRTLIDPKDIDYIIVDHTEPDHAGSVAKLLEINPNIEVVASNAAMKFLQQIVNFDFKQVIVKDGDTLSLGNKTVEFIAAPFLHWPDSIYSYIKEDKVLVTCDSFGAHYASEKLFNDLIEQDPLSKKDFIGAYQYYYEMIMGPFKNHVLNALDKISPFEIDMICPGHGPILRQNIEFYLNLYKEWSSDEAKQDEILRVTIPYVSAYGYTQQLANKIAEGIKTVGNFEVYLYDIIHSNLDDILTKIHWSDGVLFGSPTINGDALKPVWDILIVMNPLVHGGKFAGAFGSFGWSGEAVGNIEARLKQLRMKTPVPGLKINFKPSENQLGEAFEFGQQFANAILDKKKK